MRLPWLWPTIIIFSAIAVGLVTFVIPDTPVRPVIVIWFLFVCPGMLLVRFLRLHTPLVEWILALTLSFAIDAIVAGIQLYAGRWSPSSTLEILIGLSIGGAVVQLTTLQSTTTTFVSKRLQNVLARQPGLLISILLALLIGLSLGSLGTILFYVVYQNSHSGNSTVVLPSKATPHSNSSPTAISTPTPIPTSTPSVTMANSYLGTLEDIPTGTTTNISLTNIRQQQGGMSGHFGGMPENNLFNGLPGNGPLAGTVNGLKQIQFTVTSDSGQATFSFEGVIKSDGSIAGTYRSLGADTGNGSDYGLWSVVPA